MEVRVSVYISVVLVLLAILGIVRYKTRETTYMDDRADLCVLIGCILFWPLIISIVFVGIVLFIISIPIVAIAVIISWIVSIFKKPKYG